MHGDDPLCTILWREAFDAARNQIGFAKLLAEAARGVESALEFFRQFRTRQGQTDLKKAGLFGIVTAARALAIRHHVVERSTRGRLAGIKALGIGAANDLDALIEAGEVFLEFLVSKQIEDLNPGIPPSNAAEVKRLSGRNRERRR